MSQLYYFSVLVASLLYVRSTETKDCQDLILVPTETNGWTLGAKFDAKPFPVQIPTEESVCVLQLLDMYKEKKGSDPCNAAFETLTKLGNCPQGNYTKFWERWVSDTFSTFCLVGIQPKPEQTTTPETSTTTTGPSSTTKKPKSSNENINSSKQDANDSWLDDPYVEEKDDGCFPVKIYPKELSAVQTIVDIEAKQIASGSDPCETLRMATRQLRIIIASNKDPQWTYVYAKYYYRAFYDQRRTFCY
ncbi:hypothetical protein Ddc_02824 [Ditylenchus destructor]|nr:hypothetical protein Ddc_02824 [Ditylenchus destructor]